ncbi:MAG: hypothetical protein IPM56_10085 [Ignavibacteriales bacterium]|nr:MAG: hypothetical protein IPM56_10085 [Ignavibacteriales bacterium]
MSSKKYLPALVCGFGAAVLMVVPGIKNFGCCLVLPLAAGFSLVLHKKVNRLDEATKTQDAFYFGIFTGIFSAVFYTIFDLLITFISRNNDLVEALPQTKLMMQNLNLGPVMTDALNMIQGMADDIKTNGFSVLYTVIASISNLITNTIFGMIGGLLGMMYLNKNMKTKV